MTTVNIVSMLKGLREAGCKITTICKCKGYAKLGLYCILLIIPISMSVHFVLLFCLESGKMALPNFLK